MIIELTAADFAQSDYVMPDKCPIVIAMTRQYPGFLIVTSPSNLHIKNIETGTIASFVIKGGYWYKNYKDDKQSADSFCTAGLYYTVVRKIEIIKELMKSEY